MLIEKLLIYKYLYNISEQEISKTSTNNTPTIIVVKPSVTPEPNKPYL